LLPRWKATCQNSGQEISEETDLLIVFKIDRPVSGLPKTARTC